MTEPPSKELLISLVNSLCEVQGKIARAKNQPDYLKQPMVEKVEPLKAPMFFLWERLGYGTPAELNESRCKPYWMASFSASPPDYVAECCRQLRQFEIPVDEYSGGVDLRRELLAFYSD